jgi:hypothetical protein
MLSESLQIQAIADRLAGLPAPDAAPARPADSVLAQFSEPWRTAFCAVCQSEPVTAGSRRSRNKSGN